MKGKDMNGDTKPVEHRRLRRKTAKRNISVSCRKGTLGLGKDLAVAVQDLSEEGARLLVKEEVPIGTEVELSFTGLGANKRFVVVAKVMWCKNVSENFSMGVKFNSRMPYTDYFNLT